MTGAEPSPLLERLHLTLVRGGAFLQAAGWEVTPGTSPEANLIIDRGRARFFGNALRELDRFLHVLLDEAAAVLAPLGHDARGFARGSNAANKLRSVRGMMNLGSPDHERLRAVGRLRACLHHCFGEVHSTHIWQDLAIARGPLSSREVEPEMAGAARPVLVITPETLRAISLLYVMLADDLLTNVRGPRDLH